MSTILDALKKSEQERKLNQLPTLSDMSAPHEPARWPWVLLIVATLLLIVLLGLVIKLLWFSPQQGQTGTLTLSDTQRVETQNADVDGSGVRNIKESVVDSSVKSIVVSVVSYSESPSKRFIMIDGKLLRENEFIKAGLKVEEIRQDDVILNFRGKQIVRRP